MTRTAKIERKTEYLPVMTEIKEMNDTKYQIGGYLNYTDIIDYGDDRTLQGAFRKTISDSYARKSKQSLDFLWPYLWNHDYSILPPGGIYDADEDKKGLYTKVQFNPDLQLGREIYASFKAGTLKKQSMGYKAMQYEYVKENGRTIRNLSEVQIVEGSAVVFPMNDLSQVDTVKSLITAKDFQSALADRQLYDMIDDWYIYPSALREALFEALQQGSMDAVQQALTAFNESVTAWAQTILDAGGLPMDDMGYMSRLLQHDIKAGRMISASNHTTMTKAVQGIMGHCIDLTKLLQSAQPEKSLGAAVPPQPTEATQDDAVSTHLDELLTQIQLANLGRQLKQK